MELPDLCPLVRTPPSLDALLSFNRQEPPLDLSGVTVRLRPYDAKDLEAERSSINDKDVAEAPPLNAAQAQKFAAYRTVQKRFRDPLLALAFSLYTDVLRTNELIHALRKFFLKEDAMKPNCKKCKTSVEAVLFSICQAQQSTVDVLVVGRRREFTSLYTCFSGHIYVGEDASESAHTGPPRTCVIVEYDADVGLWAAVDYSKRFALMPPPPAPSNAAAADQRAAGPKSVMVAPLKKPDAVASVSSSEDEGDDNDSEAAGVSPTDSFYNMSAVYNFHDVIQRADKRYHAHRDAIYRPPPLIFIPEFQVLGTAGPQGVTAPLPPSAAPPTARQAPMPFSDLKYPNIEMTDWGLFTMLGESFQHRLPLTFSRFWLTTLTSTCTFALYVALLSLLWGGSVAACCVSGSEGAELCWNTTSPSYLNVTSDSASAEAWCAVEMCSGTLHEAAVGAFLFGSRNALGRWMWVALAAAFVCVGLSVAVNHFTMRLLAQYQAQPRISYWLSVVHVLVAAGLAAVGAWILYDVKSHKDKGSVPHLCTWFTGRALALCLTARESSCTTRLAISLLSPARDFSLAIAAFAFGAAHFLCCLLPPLPSVEYRKAGIVNAVPDTNIFSPGLYMPDGIREDQAEAVQRAILNGASGDELRTKKKSKGRLSAQGAAEGSSTGPRRTLKGVVRAMMGGRAFSRQGGAANLGGRIAPARPELRYGVHNSEDLREPGHGELERQLSLTFIPRTFDAAKLSLSTKRKIGEILHRLEEERQQGNLLCDDPPMQTPESQTAVQIDMVTSQTANRLPPRSQSDGPVLDKYAAAERELRLLERVSAQRDTVIQDIVHRLGVGARGGPPEVDTYPPPTSQGPDSVSATALEGTAIYSY